MKNVFKKLMILPAICFVLVGCGSKTVEGAKEDAKVIENEITTIEKDVEKKVKETEVVAKDDINEAMTYIQENIEKIKDEEIAKKVYEKATYLEEVAEVKIGEVEHDAAVLGKDAKVLAEKVLKASEEEKDKVIEESKQLFDDWSKKLTEEKEKLVDEFHKLLGK